MQRFSESFNQSHSTPPNSPSLSHCNSNAKIPDGSNCNQSLYLYPTQSHKYVIGNGTFCMELRGIQSLSQCMPLLMEQKGWSVLEMFELVLRDKIQLKHISDVSELHDRLYDEFPHIVTKLPLSIALLSQIDATASFIAANYIQQLLHNPMLWKTKTFKKFVNHSRMQDADMLKRDRLAALSEQYYDNKPFQQQLHKSKKATIDDFIILKCIGKGCMGKVMLVRERETGSLYALKSIHKMHILRRNEVSHARSERDILALISSFQSPFLVRLYKSFQTSTELFLLFEYHSGGDLATHLSRNGRFTIERTRFYASEIVIGIEKLHQEGIVYRDLKPENILLSQSGHIVLTDFGLSKRLIHADMQTLTFCGTAEYLAPEILLGQSYSYAVDWWSLGTLLYEMVVGTTPFWSESTTLMYQRVLEDDLIFPECMPVDLQELIVGLLQRDVQKRFSIQQIKSSDFFSTVDWKRVEKRLLVPVYVPVVQDTSDLTYFDDEFLQLPNKITPTEEAIRIGMGGEDEDERKRENEREREREMFWHSDFVGFSFD